MKASNRILAIPVLLLFISLLCSIVSAAPVKGSTSTSKGKAPARDPEPEAESSTSGGAKFQDINDNRRNSYTALIRQIPHDKLAGAGDGGSQGTLASIDENGNIGRNGEHQDTGIRIDQQKPTGEGSHWQSNIQVQMNGRQGVTTVGGTRVAKGMDTTPQQIRAKLTHSINTNTWQDLDPKIQEQVKAQRKVNPPVRAKTI